MIFRSVLTSSRHSLYSGRGGDSFVLSPLYCGSDATGWCKTREWIKLPAGQASEAEATQQGETDGLSLATAMAISAAAVNPYTGSAGKGPTRHRFVAIVMSLLNLRLACWLPNPRARKKAADGQGQTRVPTLWDHGMQVVPRIPSPVRRILRAGHDDHTNQRTGSDGPPRHEHGEFVELSDGGHFENLGLYELIRRRVDVIIVADVGCDPRFAFADLGNAIERCRVDFGVTIEFENTLADLKMLLTETSGGIAPRADTGVVIARISYPTVNGAPSYKTGHLVYIKSTLIEGLPADVYAYKLACPAFPDESTLDQWFSETQFEAYRELGYGLFERFMAKDVLAGQPAKNGGTVAALDEWLRNRQSR